MPSPSSTNAVAIADRERRIWDRLVKGDSLKVIAETEGVSRPIISRIKARVLARVQSEIGASRDALVAGQVAELRAVRREAWKEYDKSSKPKARSKKRRTLLPGAPGATPSAAVVAAEIAEEVLEGQTGNPEYLRVITKAIDTEARLLGTAAPTEIKISNDDFVRFGRALLAAVGEEVPDVDTRQRIALRVRQEMQKLAIAG